MVLIDLQKVLSTLGLVSSITKPLPIIGGVASGLLDTAGGLVNSTAGSSTGALSGLLGGAAGGILAATDVSGNSTGIHAASTSDDSNNDNSTTVSVTSDDSCSITPYTPPSPVLLESFPPYDASKALIYRYRQQQSVNLGSWFVQEQWMHPSLFTCAAGNKQAELDVASGWGSVDNARQVLERHWDEWITEKDFQYLASIGINTVRLPIGYWSLGPVYCQGTAFEAVSAAYVNAWPRVVRAINWAEKYGLGILVDLHGAPGSQNDQAHSGTSTGQQNLFNNPTNVQLTMNVLTYLTQQLVKVNNVVGIELLNEPSNVDGLPAFYSQALATLRQVSPEAAAFPFYIHDGFDMSRFADYVSTRNDFVVLDHHSYFVFGDAASQKVPANELTTTLSPGQGSVSQQLISAASEERRNIVIDEFSCALSGDALNGSSDAVADRRKFCTGQMESYVNATAGYSFWSYKTENCDTDANWCFTSAVGNSLPSTFFSYPNASIASLSTPSSDSSEGSDTTFLSFGTASTSGDDYAPPGTDDYLAALGMTDNRFYDVTEALATTEYDDLPESDESPSVSMSSSPTASSDVTAAAVSGSSTQNIDDPAGLPVDNSAQAAYAIVDSATIPTSRMALKSKRSLLTTLPERAFLWSSSMRQHRFTARHQRAHHRKIRRDGTTATDGSTAVGYTPEQAAIAKGYSDGWKAAKTFASAGNSRLGFTGQFISDALSAMNGKVLSGDEQFYRQWFMKGLADGEVQVIKMMAMAAQGPQ